MKGIKMTGQIEKISTDICGDVVLKIVIPKEGVPSDIFTLLGQMVVIEGEGVGKSEV